MRIADKNRHIIVISIDAMITEDIEYARTLPNFSKILSGASVIERVRTIYPSLTHPVHATLLTGNTAGVTGAINNALFDPKDPLSVDIWYNRLDQIKCDTILHAAKREGLTTAVACWPLTSGKSDVVDYLVPSLRDAELEKFADPLDAYRSFGARECVVELIADAVRRFGCRDVHPQIEEFQAYLSSMIIRKFKPNILFTHPSYVDNQRHAGGVFGSNISHALRETDRWLGMIIDATVEAGIYENTNFVILSDHGQINITRSISPNVYLCDKGYIDVDGEGNITSWRAFAKSAGASSQVYISDPSIYSEVYSLLCRMAEEGIYGFERVYTADELKDKYGLWGDFSFVLETDGYTSFGEWPMRPAVRGFDLSDYRFGRGTHGHEPHKGPQPVFIAKGEAFKSDVVIAEGDILNDAPTIAAAMGLVLPESKGQPVLELLK